MSDFDDLTGPAEVSEAEIGELAVVEDEVDDTVILDDAVPLDDAGVLGEKKEDEEEETEDSDFMEYMYGDQLHEL
jgi:hypothetical protein